MDFSYTPQEQAFRAELREWLAVNVPAEPVPTTLEAEAEFLSAWQRKLYAAGWAAVHWPREYGGRGGGRQLRDEIVSAATRLLDEAGEDESLSLRAVAREVGVAATSVYLHFADRDELLAAVMETTFTRMIRAADEAEAAGDRDHGGRPRGRPRRWRSHLDRARRRRHQPRHLRAWSPRGQLARTAGRVHRPG